MCSRQVRSGKRGPVLFAYLLLTVIVNLSEFLFVTFMSIILLLPLFNISIIVIVFAVSKHSYFKFCAITFQLTFKTTLERYLLLLTFVRPKVNFWRI